MNEVLRNEKKYLISLVRYYALSHLLAQALHLDGHSAGDGYSIRSLYFDTIEEKDFVEKEDGVEVRRKIRLRNYGPHMPFAMLEMKQKQGYNQKKRSLRVKRADAEELCRGRYASLLRYPDPFAAECYALMNTQCYLPKAVVEYRRKAFVAQENNIRVTFDHHIIGTEANFDIFSPNLMQYPVMDPYLVVLEVKYNGFLLSYIKDMLRVTDTSELSVGKYSLSRAVTTHYHF
ncbi:MAG TPA: polyphosphate polymerase domain-containing protein [Candidatus Limnocylindria bacterium]|nr:polyphosphate polymerase domain-containing protein [Candidatus Limnocylindria bacterium]